MLCISYMHTKSLAIIVITASLLSLMLGSYFASNPISAAPKPCAEGGLIEPCLTGQHVNENNDKIVGNPHYPQKGEDTTGNPHGDTGSGKGDPHEQIGG